MFPIKVKNLGLRPYLEVWQAMQDFTESRTSETEDEIWLVEHPPVFTQGLAGKAEHIIAPGDIPVVQIDRGGQVTYHAPGQAVMYLLLDIKRADVGVRNLVTAMENSVIELLRTFGIESAARPDAPGVYVAGNKIASLGLKIRRGRTYHGAALNVNLDLEPFSRINPCGLVGMKMVQLQDFGIDQSVAEISPKWAEVFIEQWRNLQTHN